MNQEGSKYICKAQWFLCWVYKFHIGIFIRLAASHIFMLFRNCCSHSLVQQVFIEALWKALVIVANYTDKISVANPLVSHPQPLSSHCPPAPSLPTASATSSPGSLPKGFLMVGSPQPMTDGGWRVNVPASSLFGWDISELHCIPSPRVPQGFETQPSKV